MKRVINVLCLFLLLVSEAQAQTKVLSDIAKFKFKNYGAMMDANNDVDGYYLFHEVDKLKKGKRKYLIQILDKNLNEVAKKTYIDEKHVSLIDAGFDGNRIMFALLDYRKGKEGKVKFISFDRKGERQPDVHITVTKKDVAMMKMAYAQGAEQPFTPVDGKGFLFTCYKKDKKIGYRIKFISTTGGKHWSIETDREIKAYKTVQVAGVGKKAAVFYEGSRKSLFSKKIEMKIMAVDIETGKKIFEENMTKDKSPKMLTNAAFTNDNIILLGEYLAPGVKVTKARSEGLFIKKYNYEGVEQSYKKVKWKSEMFKKFAALNDEKGKNYIYFHDMIRLNDGSYYVVGEQYRKTASAAGIAMTVLSRGQGGNSNSQLTITDAFYFKFDKDFNLVDVTKFNKGKSRVPTFSDFLSPQMNAHLINQTGGFDYSYTQIDKKNDRFYSVFIDYERLKGQKNKNAFKSIIYNDGKLTEDKIYLSKGKTKFRPLPAKIGHVLLVRYNKKKKELSLQMEKLNIKQ